MSMSDPSGPGEFDSGDDDDDGSMSDPTGPGEFEGGPGDSDGDGGSGGGSGGGSSGGSGSVSDPTGPGEFEGGPSDDPSPDPPSTGGGGGGGGSVSDPTGPGEFEGGPSDDPEPAPDPTPDTPGMTDPGAPGQPSDDGGRTVERGPGGQTDPGVSAPASAFDVPETPEGAAPTPAQQEFIAEQVRRDPDTAGFDPEDDIVGVSPGGFAATVVTDAGETERQFFATGEEAAAQLQRTVGLERRRGGETLGEQIAGEFEQAVEEAGGFESGDRRRRRGELVDVDDADADTRERIEDLESQLEEQTGRDLVPGRDFTVRRTAEGFTADLTPAAERRFAAGELEQRLEARTGMDLQPGDDFTLTQTDEGFEASLTPDAERAIAAPELEEQLETQTGVDLEAGEDFTVQRDDGEFTAALTDAGRQRVRQESPEQFGDIPIVIPESVGAVEVFGEPVTDRLGGRRVEDVLGGALGEFREEVVQPAADVVAQADARIGEAAGRAVATEGDVVAPAAGAVGTTVGGPAGIAAEQAVRVASIADEETAADVGARVGEAGGRGAVLGAGDIASVPITTPLAVKEGVEFAAAGVEAGQEGRGGEIVSDVDIDTVGATPVVTDIDVLEGGFAERAETAGVAAATEAVEVAREEPIETGARLGGSVVASGAFIGGASQLGGGVGRAASVLVQPGEEAAVAAARRGLISQGAARSVPGVHRVERPQTGGGGPFMVGFGRAEAERPRAEAPEETVEITGEDIAEPRSGVTGMRQRGDDPRVVEDVDVIRRRRQQRQIIDEPADRSQDLAFRRARERLAAEAETPEVGRVDRLLQSVLDRTRLTEPEINALQDPTLGTEPTGVSEMVGAEAVAGERARAEAAQQPGVETGQELDQRLREMVRSEVDAGVETGVETGVDVRSRTETGTETRTETRVETAQEVETRAETALETLVETGVETGVEVGIETGLETGAEAGLPPDDDLGPRGPETDESPEFFARRTETLPGDPDAIIQALDAESVDDLDADFSGLSADLDDLTEGL